MLFRSPAFRRRVAGAHTVRSMAEAETATDDPAAPQVVFCAPVREEAALVGRLTGRSAPRTVVVLVGDARPGRWSIKVCSTRSPRRDERGAAAGAVCLQPRSTGLIRGGHFEVESRIVGDPAVRGRGWPCR